MMTGTPKSLKLLYFCDQVNSGNFILKLENFQHLVRHVLKQNSFKKSANPSHISNKESVRAFVVNKLAGQGEDALLQYLKMSSLVDFEKPRTDGSFFHLDKDRQ